MAGAPLGNNNAGRGSEYRDALRYVLERYLNDDYPDFNPRNALERIIVAQLSNAESGDNVAINAVADRMDGKPKQEIDIEADIQQRIEQTGEITLNVIASTESDI